MPKITFLGAGSTVFAKNLLGDILSFPEFNEATISLHDINQKRLDETEAVATGLLNNWVRIRPSKHISIAGHPWMGLITPSACSRSAVMSPAPSSILIFPGNMVCVRP